jgi:hypothetical protein
LLLGLDAFAAAALATILCLQCCHHAVESGALEGATPQAHTQK